MPYEETGKEKVKREAYMKANKERGIRAEKQKEYELFGTTEQNIPIVNPMGDVVSGGEVGSPMPKGVRAMMDALGAKGMKKGGSVKSSKPKVSSASKRADGCCVKGKTRGKMM